MAIGRSGHHVYACLRGMFALVLLGATLAHAQATLRQLTGTQILKLIVGHEVTDDAHWADRYLHDGRAQGHSLGKTYVGTWKIEQDQLCLTRSGKQPRTECFEIWRSGDRIEYQRGGAVLASGMLRPGSIAPERR